MKGKIKFQLENGFGVVVIKQQEFTFKSEEKFKKGDDVVCQLHFHKGKLVANIWHFVKPQFVKLDSLAYANHFQCSLFHKAKILKLWWWKGERKGYPDFTLMVEAKDLVFTNYRIEEADGYGHRIMASVDALGFDGLSVEIVSNADVFNNWIKLGLPKQLSTIPDEIKEHVLNIVEKTIKETNLEYSPYYDVELQKDSHYLKLSLGL